MQTQDASSDLLFKLWPWFEANKKRLLAALVVAGVVVAVFAYLASQREENENQAGLEFTKVLTTPSTSPAQMAGSFEAVAAKYPGTAAALRAQLQAGGMLFAAGQYPEAQAKFQKFLDGGSVEGPLGATAQLGVAACMEAAGKPEAAAAYQKVVASFQGTASAEVAKQALARLTPKPAGAVTNSIKS